MVPLHGMHSVRSAFGPVPAGHAEQVVRSVLTTRGERQVVHSIPNGEKCTASHIWHSDLSGNGAEPGMQDSQNVCSMLATLPGCEHAWHWPPAELTVPISQGVQSA